MAKKLGKKTTKKKVTRKSGLGRGLDALLGGRPAASQESGAEGSELQTLGIEQLQPGQYQPRSIMDQDKLQELAWWDWSHDRLRDCLSDFRSLSAEAFLEKYA